MANIKDFATSLITTAPSPANSGTSLVVTSSQGVRYPAVPFNAVAHPDGQLPTLDNAERVLVTDISTDTLTIVRAQGGTTAKSIASGWRLSNAMFVDDVREVVNPYKFSAYRSAALNVSGSVAVPLDVEQIDTNNNFNTSTGVYTAPVNGYYYVSGQVTLTNNPVYFWADIVKNGVSVRRGNRMSSTNANGQQAAVSALLFLQAGDTVGLGATTNTSARLEVGLQGQATTTYLDGFLVSTT